MRDISKLKYTETHEWVFIHDKTATIGITDHAQKEISDVVFVDLPKIGAELRQKSAAMVVESVKAAFDIYAPISGKVSSVNEKLKDNPELVNNSPYDDGWLFRLEITNPKEVDTLLTEAQCHSVKNKH